MTHPMKEDIDMERPEHQSHYLDAFIAGLDPDPLYVPSWDGGWPPAMFVSSFRAGQETTPSCCDLACYEDSDCTCDGCKALDAGLAAFVAEYSTEPEPPTRIFLWIGVAVVVAAILLWVTLR